MCDKLPKQAVSPGELCACWPVYSGPVHSTPEKFKNGVFTLKTHQMFSVHTTPEKFENAAITGHFGFFVWGKLRQGSHMKSSALFSVHTKKPKAGIFKFLQYEERFRKALLSWRISVDGSRNRRNKAAFSKFSSVVWKGPWDGYSLLRFQRAFALALRGGEKARQSFDK